MRIRRPLVTFVAALMLAQPCLSDTQEVFFPSEVWGKEPASERDKSMVALYERWFGGQLRAMEERPLSNLETPVAARNTVRLLFLPTFTPASMVKLEYGEDTGPTYAFKRLSGAGGYEPGELVSEVVGDVPVADLQPVLALIDAINPWADTTVSKIDPPKMLCFDGTRVVFEFRSETAYKVVSRHECELDQDSSIRQLVRELDELTTGLLLGPDGFDAVESRPVDTPEFEAPLVIISSTNFRDVTLRESSEFEPGLPSPIVSGQLDEWPIGEPIDKP